MFGYIRPLKGELKVREFEKFKALYCSLCHAMGREYGHFARFLLYYDFVFLAMLLWEENELPQYEFHRCIASPIRKKCVCTVTKVLELSAGYSMILTWWKLKDTTEDETFLKSLPARCALVLYRRAYGKAEKKYPAFALKVRENLKELKGLEENRNTSMDAAADKFADILSAACDSITDETKRRALQLILYQTGRMIYLLDAYDDLAEDLTANRYNPIAVRFAVKEDKLPEEDAELLKRTLSHSMNLIGAAFELLPQNTWTQLVRNIIYLGMPDVAARVLDGTWRKPKVRAPK